MEVFRRLAALAYNIMKTVLAILLLIALGTLWSQVTQAPLSSTVAYSNSTLGFRYLPPSEMHDKTERSKAEYKAETSHKKHSANLLLAMSSGSDDTVSNWHSLTILTYPREMFNDLDDVDAETKISAWVGGFSDSSLVPRQTVLSGQSFAVFVFGRQEGSAKKGAVVWTTVRKDKLLSFAFVANSPEQLKALAESMKSVQFF
jgi:hypothetical protein